uniref:ATP synthase F0 subunit 8 n=1 Tax=Leptomastidea bifasciata TaxID=1880993 RepID=UPI002E75D866|nr:ATP synthase F0 subunit 8 [Leptomastidea bifasciata]WPT46957.1 ATP synthase F0 subunit 8 [Leptomastidea bifasciata]
MPQMMPLMWFFLYIYFLLMYFLMILLVYNYFFLENFNSNIKKNNLSNEKYLNNFSLKW